MKKQRLPSAKKQVHQQIKKSTTPRPKGVSPAPPHVRAAEEAAKKGRKPKKRPAHW